MFHYNTLIHISIFQICNFKLLFRKMLISFHSIAGQLLLYTFYCITTMYNTHLQLNMINITICNQYYRVCTGSKVYVINNKYEL